MSIDYFASFETISINRFDALHRVMLPLKNRGARFDVDFCGLEYNGEKFEYTGCEFEDLSIQSGVERSVDWQGIEFHMTLFERGCSMLLLNAQPTHTTVIFVVSGGLVRDQMINPQLEVCFVDLLAEFSAVLDADFCVVEPGWTCKERESSDVDTWTQDILSGKERDWIHVLLADRSRAEWVSKMVSAKYDRRESNGLAWFSKRCI